MIHFWFSFYLDKFPFDWKWSVLQRFIQTRKVSLGAMHCSYFKSILAGIIIVLPSQPFRLTVSLFCCLFFCRILYLGLTLGLRTLSFFLCISGFVFLKRHIKREGEYPLTNGSAELESLRKEEKGSVLCEHCLPASDGRHDRETCLWVDRETHTVDIFLEQSKYIHIIFV